MRLGGFFPPAPQEGIAPVLQAEKILGRRIDPVMWFRSWDTPAGPGRFRPEYLDGLDDRDVVITWEPWRPGGGAVQPEYAPAAIAAGLARPVHPRVGRRGQGRLPADLPAANA